jgi:orotidine-5'-phosphate decarboxylase
MKYAVRRNAMTSVDPVERIIWSADLPDEETLMGHLDLMPELKHVKIDRLFVTDVGLSVIDRLTERGIRVFDDAKIIEIPSKMIGIAKKHLAHKPWMLNCMAGGQSSGLLVHEDPETVDGLKRFADACHSAGTRPCAVTVLTSKTGYIISREFNGRDSQDQVLYYVEALLKCGFTDVVCSPKELRVIRAEKTFDSLDLNLPGIRPAGFSAGDQARVDTPDGALRAGATRLVIGRPITEGDPAVNLKDIVASITAPTP